MKGWEKGVDLLRQAIEKDRKNPALQNELVIARHIALSVRSTINIIRFYDLLQRWEKNKARLRAETPHFGVQARPDKVLSAKLKKILGEEILNAQEDKELVKAEPRLGFHPEAHVHLFTPDDLDYKISLAQDTLSKLRI